MEQLKANDAEDIVVFGGGVIPQQDIPALQALGVKAIFGPGTPAATIIQTFATSCLHAPERTCDCPTPPRCSPLPCPL